MGGAHHCSEPPISEMTYTVSSGTIKTLLYHTILVCVALHWCPAHRPEGDCWYSDWNCTVERVFPQSAFHTVQRCHH